jgi:hypothetical protein
MSPPRKSSAIVQQLAAQILWGHNCALLDRVKDVETRAFYIPKTIEQFLVAPIGELASWIC